MPRPKGGRGHMAPYDTKMARIPVPIGDQVRNLVERYQDFIADGGNPLNPPILLDSVHSDKPVDDFKELEELRSQLAETKAYGEKMAALANERWVALQDQRKEIDRCWDDARTAREVVPEMERLIKVLQQENASLRAQLTANKPVYDFQAEQLEQEKIADKPIYDFQAEQEPVRAKPVNDFEPMRMRALANLLGQKSHTYISHLKSKPEFYEWSRQRDPHGVGWRYDAESKLFYPVEAASD